jgi:serine/threonine-protein kinase
VNRRGDEEAAVDEVEFGRYRLMSLLGRGGMGEVWRAHDTGTDRIVAIKLLPANFSDNEDFQRRFRREAHAAARLDSPHVIPIYDYGEIDGRLYVCMRLIDGRDLQAVLADGPLEPGRAVRIIEGVALALHAAHEVGLLHRDVKPSNILLDKNDFAYLIDFGIARAADETRLTKSGNAIGTFQYIAPERLGTRREEDARADIYSLACVLYECLTGHPPFDEDTMAQLVAAHLNTPPPQPSTTQPDVPAQMDGVIATGMAKNPDQRYATTVELARAAHDATTVPLSGPRPSVPVYGSSQPDLLAAAPFHGQETQLAATGAAPVLPPPPGPPLPDVKARKRPSWRRRRVVIPAAVAIVVLIGGGVFAAVKVSGARHDNKSSPAAAPAAAAPNTGPFTGTYRADYGPETYLDGEPGGPGAMPPGTEAWGVRSVCRPTGCVATASRRSGNTTQVSTLVFDDVGGRWLAVAIVPGGSCKNATVELWEVFTLQPHPDGTLAGEDSMTTSNGCGGKQTVTFTRTGDVDVDSLPDPASQPPRVASPAEALHGQYQETRTFTAPPNEQHDYSVRTDCLRTGDRCMSYFHSPPEQVLPLVFGSGKWTLDVEDDPKCPSGDTSHRTITAQNPLPQPPQDPITLLTGRGHQEQTGSCTGSFDFDEKFVRTGD